MLTRLLREWGARLRDPKNQGNVMMGAGAVLVADGLLGLENPFDGRKTRPGIVGAFFAMIIGLVFLLVGLFAIGKATGPVPGGVTTTGTILSYHTSSGANNKTTYSPEIEFTASNGKKYRFTDSVSTSNVPTIGATVSVSYNPNNPAIAHNLSNGSKNLKWIFAGIGGLVFLIGGFTFVLRAITLAGGLLLLRWGWQRRKQAERGEQPTAGPRVGSALEKFGTWMQAKAEKRAGRDPSSWFGTTEPAQPTQAVAVPATVGAPGHTNPPPGWYRDPQDSSRQRWWDGSAWGEQTQ